MKLEALCHNVLGENIQKFNYQKVVSVSIKMTALNDNEDDSTPAGLRKLPVSQGEVAWKHHEVSVMCKLWNGDKR